MPALTLIALVIAGVLIGGVMPADATSVLGSQSITSIVTSTDDYTQIGVGDTGRFDMDIDWGVAPTSFTYQWYLDDRPIADATGATYAPTIEEIGHELSGYVIGHRDGYEDGEVWASPVTVIKGTQPAPTGIKIVGSPAVGAELSASLGSLAGANGVAYQWVVGSRIMGRSATFTVPGAARGRGVWLQVGRTLAGYHDTSATTCIAIPGKVRHAKVYKASRKAAPTTKSVVHRGCANASTVTVNVVRRGRFPKFGRKGLASAATYDYADCVSAKRTLSHGCKRPGAAATWPSTDGSVPLRASNARRAVITVPWNVCLPSPPGTEYQRGIHVTGVHYAYLAYGDDWQTWIYAPSQKGISPLGVPAFTASAERLPDHQPQFTKVTCL